MIDIHQLADDLEVEWLTLDGFDDAVLGVARQFSNHLAVAYSLEKIIASLMADGLTYEEAVEFYEFNIAGAWVGPGTPIIIEEGSLCLR